MLNLTSEPWRGLCIVNQHVRLLCPLFLSEARGLPTIPSPQFLQLSYLVLGHSLIGGYHNIIFKAILSLLPRHNHVDYIRYGRTLILPHTLRSNRPPTWGLFLNSHRPLLSLALLWGKHHDFLRSILRSHSLKLLLTHYLARVNLLSGSCTEFGTGLCYV